MQIDEWLETYTGGAFETNAFLADLPEGRILVDAPEGVAAWAARLGARIDLLFLTHGHFDHTWDAARIVREHGCPVLCHADAVPMVTDRDFYPSRGFPFPIEPVTPTRLLGTSPDEPLLGQHFQVLEVPGHCPGSLCLFDRKRRVLFGGDVLFAGGVGRWDLPGGDRDLLLTGIRDKLLPLGDEVVVLPGHGPATTIGDERRTNPYVAGPSR